MIVSSLHPTIKALLLCILVAFSVLEATDSFTITSWQRIHKDRPHHNQISKTYLQNSDTHNTVKDDAELMRLVSKEMLQQLCLQYNISTHGTKPHLLYKLRDFADKQVQDERKRRNDRKRRVEKGSDDDEQDGIAVSGKAKHTIIENEEEEKENEDELEGVFYFAAPSILVNTTSDTRNNSTPPISSTSNTRPQNKIMSMKSSASVTAPPLHLDIPPNEKGERAVTVYSTTDQNDLTSVASHLSSSAPDMMMGDTNMKPTSSHGLDSTLLGGPFGESSQSQRQKEVGKDSDLAEDILTDLVRNLLAMTGAPGFQDDTFHDDDDVMTFEEQDSFMNKNQKNFVPTTRKKDESFAGFDPTRVPTSMIMQASKYLRVANGEPLRKVLSEFEIQAIGYDGMAGDDKRKGGGHYLEVQKVEAFLQGFRTAEIRRVARQTTSLLLDKLITEGVKGLDRTLMLMSRGGDESSEVGELNDSLLSYLDNVIKQQEKNIAVEGHTQKLDVTSPRSLSFESNDDNLWNITQTADGVIETLNLNDPKLMQSLQQELKKSPEGIKPIISTGQKLVMILKLLRDRVKAEALYPNDEKGQNLRVLAYCLQSQTEHERKKLILEYFGSSLGVS